MPGTSANAALIFVASSGKVCAEVHCFLSFKITIISEASIGIGSVGTSPLPILVTTFSTSGNLLFKIWAAFCVLSMVVVRLLPGRTRVSTAKSPSSSEGINSPPSWLIINTAPIKSKITSVKIVFGIRSTLSSVCR
ncbi:hypothetical protein D3C73_633710 [compost metagenome]